MTNQFCFEHRVNVCEHCMVKKHPNCVVQSYLQWLQDSDYDPNCPLCHQDLSEEPCVRLVCYHLFHWVCLDRYMRNLPTDTAPAGYACPSCQECIFPAEKLVSPVADALRNLLKDVNWARAGLGMPLLEDRVEKRPNFQQTNAAIMPPPPSGPRPAPEGQSGTVTMDGLHSGGVAAGGGTGSANNNMNIKSSDESVISFNASDPELAHSRSYSKQLPTSPLLLNSDHDADEDKYRRRSPLRFIARWWRTTVGHSLLRTRRLTRSQRMFIWILIGFLALVSLMIFLSHFSSGSSYDPMLDPMNNPNIHVDASI